MHIDNVKVESHLDIFSKNFSTTKTTTSASGTLVLSSGSSCFHFLLGTASNFSVNMPVGSTVEEGRHFIIANASSAVVNIRNSSSTVLTTLKPNFILYVYCRNSTSPGDWSWFEVPQNLTASAVSFDNSANDFESTETQSAIEEAAYGKRLKYKANKVHVSKNGDDITGSGTHHNPFATIEAALDSITLPDEDNQYVILVAPGVYEESGLVCPPYVSIIGSSIQKTIIDGGGELEHILSVKNDAEVSFLTLQNAGSGFAALNATDCGDFGQCHKISIYDCEIGILCEAETLDCQFYAEYVDVNGDFINAVKNVAVNGFESNVFLENFWTFPEYDDELTHIHILTDGLNAITSLRTCELTGVYEVDELDPVDDRGVCFGENGGEVRAFATVFQNLYRGVCSATTADVRIEATGITIYDCEKDLGIPFDTCSGDIFGVLRRDRVINNSPLTLTLTYQDPFDGDLNHSRILATRAFAPELDVDVIVPGNVEYLEPTSQYYHVYDGTAMGFRFELPDAMTLRIGHHFILSNYSPNQIIVSQFGNTLPFFLNSKSVATMVLKANMTQSGEWVRVIGSASTFSGVAPVICGYSANAGGQRFLEFFSGNPSNDSPFVVIVNSLLVGISVAGTANTTAEIGVFSKVGTVYTLLSSLVLTNESSKFNANLNIEAPAGTFLSVRMISGSIQKPYFAIYIAGQ